MELGEPFTVSAQVFLEGRATVRATAVLKNPRGRVMARVPMTQANAGLDIWTAMLQAGSPTDLAPWDDGFADVLGQLGNWKVAIEGWADTYKGRATVRATAVLKNPRGRVMARVPMTQANAGLDIWTAMLQAGSPTDLAPWDDGFADVLGQLGNWKVAIEGWADTYTDWVLDATARVNADAGSADAEGAIVRGSEILTRWAATRDAGLDATQRKMLRETAKQMLDATIPAAERLAIAQIDSEILTRWAATRDAGLDATQRKMLRETAKQMLDATIPAAERLAIAQIDEIEALHTTNPLRDGLTAGRDRVFHVERPKSSCSAWYQFSPRSEGATVNERGETVPGTLRTAISGLERAKSEGFTIAYLPAATVNERGETVPGTLRTAISGLERAKSEGFTIAYLPAIFPIDHSAPDACLFAVGTAAGGHDTVDPELGSMDDFKAFCARAHELGLEVALGLPLRCSSPSTTARRTRACSRSAPRPAATTPWTPSLVRWTISRPSAHARMSSGSKWPSACRCAAHPPTRG